MYGHDEALQQIIPDELKGAIGMKALDIALKLGMMRAAKTGNSYEITYHPMYMRGAAAKKTIKDIAAFYGMGIIDGFDFYKENFAGSEFADDNGNSFSVEEVVAFAKKTPNYFHKDFPLSKIKHDLSYWQGDEKRMMKSDTSYPLLVIKDENGHLSVADGLNRMKKAVDVENKEALDVYLVPKKDIMQFALNKNLKENFADGKNPEHKGDSKRYGVPTKSSVSTLRKVAKQGGRKGQLAHWMANMKAGKARAKK